MLTIILLGYIGCVYAAFKLIKIKVSPVSVAASVGSKGFLAVRIVLDDAAFASQVPLGAAGTTAIYTDFARPFQAISKVVMRIKAWMYYLPA